ncbi:ABC transporter ATP-binding protein [Marinactinospora thermotolerans]|uniref:ABC-type quaternary amine transporter n=1 Tax=Marinactinospora thermotolerans DSM 45154 TaxID=1122192 RepID=A0A1T4LDQ8_9ACTN|nr:ABC transporter ATP-binding protein [Marinactinospora thermotolerans]SJZ52899.1 2-aminoethylphosphonate transport system ATP-binding protein [Marinactinospora thermotolerans DSM 45154]
MSAAPAIQLRGVGVDYGRKTALADLDLTVERGETLALLGPSGSGKSTALKAVAGFVRPSRGRVLLEGRDVTDLPPHQRGIGVVVQNYALFPHMSVAANVGFGLRARRAPRAEIRERVAEVLDLVGMSAFADRSPRQLSGGQQQRVAIARALAIRPAVLLLDEPLSALDAALREEMVGELLRLRAELPDTTIVHVTHDQSEALALAHRIAVMRDARLVDVGPAREMYRTPRTEFTAAFLGAANLLPVEVVEVDGEGGATVRLGDAIMRARVSGELDGRRRAVLGVRPQRVGVHAEGTGGLPARLLAAQWRGEVFRLDLRLDGAAHSGQEVRVRAEVASIEGLPPVGGRVALTVPDGCPLIADASPEEET